MRKLFLILLFTSQLFATNWYVRPLTGEYGLENGTSWANAFDGFADIAWGSLAPGDYLYVSGGADSAIYYEELIPQCQGSHGNVITIIAGKYSPSPSGHSGRVIIDGQDETRTNSIFFEDMGYGESPRYITVKGFELRNASRGIDFNIDDNIAPVCVGVTIDSLYIYDFWSGKGIGIGGNTDHLTIKNCLIVTPLLHAGETDCLYFGGAGELHPRETKVHDNILYNRNQDPRAHNDAVQGVEADGFIFYRNIVINDSVNSPEGGGMPFILGDHDDHWNEPIANRHPVIVYNNYMYMGGAWYCAGAASGFTFNTRYYESAEKQPLTFLFNNTILTNGPQLGGVGPQYRINLSVNNIIAMWCLPDDVVINGCSGWRSGGAPSWWSNYYLQNGFGEAWYMDSIRNNLFWREDSTQTGLFAGSCVYSIGGTGGIGNWSDWVAKGGTGLNRDPLMVTIPGRGNQRDLIPDLKEGSPAIDAGEDVGPLIDWIYDTWNTVTWDGWYDLPKTDIYGNDIVGDRDIGCFEYQSDITDTIPTFSFTAVTNAALNTEYIGKARFSSIAVDSSFHVWTTSAASFKINYNGTYSTAMKDADPDDTVYVKNQSSSSNAILTRETIVAGGESRNFDVTTFAVADTIPSPFTFLDYGYVNRSNIVTSYAIKLAGFDSCNAYFAGNNFAIYRNGAWQGSSSVQRKIYLTDSIRVSLVSSSNYSTIVSATFTAGGVTDTWYVTTKGNGQGVDSLGVETVTGETQQEGRTPLKTIDGKGALSGDDLSRWAAQPMPKDLVYDLGSIKTVVKTRFSFFAWNTSRIYQYYIDASDDNTNWYRIVSEKASSSSEYTSDSLAVGVRVRYIKVTCASNNQSAWAGIWEGKIYGASTVGAPVDTVPSVSFVNVTNANFIQRYETSGIFTDADSTFWVTAGADSFHIGSLTDYRVGGDTAHVTDTVYVVNRSSPDYLTADVLTLTAGGVPFYWTITTRGTFLPSKGGWWTQPGGKRMVDKNGNPIIGRKIQAIIPGIP